MARTVTVMAMGNSDGGTGDGGGFSDPFGLW